MELIEEYHQYIESWTGLYELTPIYDTKQDDDSTSTINRSICGRKNLLILIKTDEGYLFGTFIEKEVPHPKSSLQFVKDGPKNCVFTLKNSFGTDPTGLRLKKKKGETLGVFPNSEREAILTVKKCFTLYRKGEKESKVHPFFNRKYNDVTQYACCLFTGEDFINWERIVIFQMN